MDQRHPPVRNILLNCFNRGGNFLTIEGKASTTIELNTSRGDEAGSRNNLGEDRDEKKEVRS